MLSIDGLATGLDTTAIIEGLVSVYQGQINRLSGQQQKIVAEQAAFKGVEAQLLTLQSSATKLSRIQNSIFAGKSVTSSDESIAIGSASQSAVTGVYSIRVNSLAQAHQVSTEGLAEVNSQITQGTIDFRVGSGNVVSITVDDNNDTLQGLADSINAVTDELNATVVNDGSGGGSPYRLLLAATKTGASNNISVTNNLADSTAEATKPTFDLGNPVQAAADASITLGSGTGAIAIQKSTNVIDDVIPGVTLDLKSASFGQDITITVASDVEPAKDAVLDFVDSFNDFISYVNDATRFDAETESASILLGNRSVISIQDEVRSAMAQVVPGVATGANRLSAIGFSFNDSGKLDINSAKLDDALNGRIDGITSKDLSRLFALDGQSTNTGVQFIIGGSNTKATTAGYEIDISQAAERASTTATNALAATTVIDSSNNTFSITIDGTQSSDLVIADGSYTRSELAQLVQSVIEADAELSGREVSVTLNSDKLQITSQRYGADSEVAIGTGNALTSLGFDGTESALGKNVVGNFIVDGVAETAVGSGQFLIGDSGNANTAGLQVRVTLTSADVQPGAEAVLTVSRGVASRLGQILENFLDPVTGKIKAINEGFDDRIQSVEDSITRQNEALQLRQEALSREFIALETAISQLQSTGNFLTSQLASLSSLAPNK